MSKFLLLLSLWAVCAVASASIDFDGGPAYAANLDTWQSCMRTRAPARAIKDCTTIISSGKELPANLSYAYLYRSNAYAFCRERELATKDYDAASRLDTTLVHPYVGLGRLFLASEDFAHAEEEFAKAIEKNGEDADIDTFTFESLGRFRQTPLFLRGFARFKERDYAGALADYDQAIKICPTCGLPARDKALALTAQHKFDEASAAYDRAITLNMRAPDAFWGRGLLMRQMSKFDLAILNYSEAIRLDPKFVLAYQFRAAAYARLGKSKEAEEDRKQEALIEKAAIESRQSKCEHIDAISGVADGDVQEEEGDVARSVGGSGLNDAALTALFTGKEWEARQGLWQADLEFRRDGSFRQRSQDSSSKLAITTDGAWAVSQSRLCIYTNVSLCLIAKRAGENLSLARTDGTLEYLGKTSKFRTVSADNSTAPIAELPLDEKLLPGKPGSDNGKKTLLYYIHGFDGTARAHSELLQYFVGGIQQSNGWDVIDADYPLKLSSQPMAGEANKFGATAYVARRVRELKAQGYERIIVGGQSWGGWTALVLSTQRNLPIDGILMVAPACCAWQADGVNQDSQEFANNKLYFDQLVQRVAYPTVAVFFAHDEFEPGDRGANAKAMLTQHGIPNLIINHPRGFAGHGAAWHPVFDYVYRDCIVSFLTAPKTAQCGAPTYHADFRTALFGSQLRYWKIPTVAPSELIGKEFAVYPAGYFYKIVSPDQTELKSYGFGQALTTSTFRNSSYCIGGRVKYELPESTDEVCMKLMRWSDREVLAVDSQSGRVVQWWVEQTP